MLNHLRRGAAVALLTPVLVVLAASVASAQDSSDSPDGSIISSVCDTS